VSRGTFPPPHCGQSLTPSNKILEKVKAIVEGKDFQEVLKEEGN